MKRILTVMLMLIGSIAYAKNQDGRYDNVDPKIKRFFESQRNMNGVSCCDSSDGSRIEDSEWKVGKEGYEVLIKGKWWKVPPHAVLNGVDRPDGVYGAILWMSPGTEDNPLIWCFLPGAGI